MHAHALTMFEQDSRSAGTDDPRAAALVDVTVVSLCSYEKLARLVDFKKVRAMLLAEADRAGDDTVHLTPLFIYLWALAKPWYITGDVMACVREISASLQQRGVRVRLPDAYRFPARSREASRAPERRVPVGTRVGDRRRRTPQPMRDG